MSISKVAIILAGFLILFTVSLVTLAEPAVAEEENPEETTEEQHSVEPPKANAGDDVEQLSGRKVVLTAVNQKNTDPAQFTYHWDFGDEQLGEGLRVEHDYQTAGDYKVTLTVSNEAGKDIDELVVKVFDETIILLADKTLPEDELHSLQRYASQQRILLFTVRDTISKPDYVLEGSLVDSLLENSEVVKKSSALIVWTNGNLGLNVLAKFAQKAEDLDGLEMPSKAVVNVTEGGYTSMARYAQSTFDVLKPQYILLTKKTAINSVIMAGNADNILKEVRASGIDHNLISFYSERGIKKLGVTNFMSYTLNFLINRGVSTDSIILMLMLPIIATIIAFARQFIGIKTFGIYTPTIITLSFLATGLKYGLTIFLVILVVATVVRLFFKKFRLLYLPRMAMVLSVVAFSILGMFVVGALTNRTGIISLSILPVLVMIILVEKFIAIQIEKGPKTAIMLSLETILVSVACYYIASWNSFTTFILAYPEVILLTFVINILLGRWVGLRISEYIRFREIKKTSRQVNKK